MRRLALLLVSLISAVDVIPRSQLTPQQKSTLSRALLLATSPSFRMGSGSISARSPSFPLGSSLGRRADEGRAMQRLSLNVMTESNNDPFDQSVYRVLTNARAEAKSLGATSVDTDHLLLAGTMQKDEVKIALESCGLTAERLRNHLVNKRLRGQSYSDVGVGQSLFGRDTGEVTLSFGRDTEHALKVAASNARPGLLVQWYELFLAMLKSGGRSSKVYLVLKELGIDPDEVYEEVFERFRSHIANLDENRTVVSLANVTTDLTQKAREGKLDPVVGRDSEIIRSMKILTRRRKNNPILLGDPGVGKTAIAEGLAQRIADGDVPPRLLGSRVLSLELGLLVAGTKYRGEFEERLTKIIDEVKKSDDIILFIDEIHNLVGAGSAEGGMDGANVMKPALARGELQVLGATTIDEYRKYFEKDGALERRFQPVKIEEPSLEQTLQILTALSQRYEDHHRVTYSPDALEAAVKLSARYVPDRFLPDKAIDLLDEAGASVDMGSFLNEGETSRDGEAIVSAEDMASVVSEWTGVPVSKLTAAESKSMLSIESKLHERVIGQDFAVSSIARALRRARVGLRSPHRPVASMIFCGPTGVGKTELAKAIAESYYGDEKAMVRLDMSEYMESFSVSRLTGPPPGYVGFESGGQLTEAVRRSPHTVVLFDEIEKAHPDVFNTLLQVLDDGRLTDNKGRTIDFTNTLIILTSNVGSRKILEVAEKADTGKEDREALHVSMRRAAKAELGKAFRPEFLNRLDEVIVFEALSQGNIEAVAHLMLKEFKDHCKEKDLHLSTTTALSKALAEVGYSATFGARPLRRALQRMCEDAVAEAVLEGFVKEGEKLKLDHDGKDGVIIINANGQKRTRAPSLSQGIEEKIPVPKGAVASTRAKAKKSRKTKHRSDTSEADLHTSSVAKLSPKRELIEA